MPSESEGFTESVVSPGTETAAATAVSMGEGHAACDAWIARLGAEVTRLREALAERDGELAMLRDQVPS